MNSFANLCSGIDLNALVGREIVVSQDGRVRAATILRSGNVQWPELVMKGPRKGQVKRTTITGSIHAWLVAHFGPAADTMKPVIMTQQERLAVEQMGWAPVAVTIPESGNVDTFTWDDDMPDLHVLSMDDSLPLPPFPSVEEMLGEPTTAFPWL